MNERDKGIAFIRQFLSKFLLLLLLLRLRSCLRVDFFGALLFLVLIFSSFLQFR